MNTLFFDEIWSYRWAAPQKPYSVSLLSLTAGAKNVFFLYRLIDDIDYDIGWKEVRRPFIKCRKTSITNLKSTLFSTRFLPKIS